MERLEQALQGKKPADEQARERPELEHDLRHDGPSGVMVHGYRGFEMTGSAGASAAARRANCRFIPLTRAR